jgi:hypothetical protein
VFVEAFGGWRRCCRQRSGVDGGRTLTGRRAKIILGVVEVEYLYSSSLPALITFTPPHQIEDRLGAV